MAYTVKKLSKLSGVTVRTLHFYDELGLLKPCYTGSNGYRYYEEKELLQLQQILFFKELGFALAQIGKILGRSDFDQLAALHSHRKALTQEWERTGQLIETIDKTIKHLKREKKMKDDEIYGGLITKGKQKEYEAYLKNRLGEDHPSFAECEKNTKNWKKADWQQSMKEGDLNMRKLAELMEKNFGSDSSEVQEVIRKHHKWLNQFWTPDRESYIALGQSYIEFEWQKFFRTYDANHPRLAMFLAESMKVFAERELA